MSDEIPERGETWLAEPDGDGRNALILSVYDGGDNVTAQVVYPDGETILNETFDLGQFLRDWRQTWAAAPASCVGQAVGAGAVLPNQSWKSKWAPYGVFVYAVEDGGALIRFWYLDPSEFQPNHTALTVATFLAAYQPA